MINENQIKAAIRKLRLTDKTRIELRDGGDRGAGRLILTIRATPRRTTSEWYAVYHREERRRMTKIGSYPIMSIAEARKKFREEFAPTISAGGDPTGSRRRIPKAERRTVRELFEAYVASLDDAGKRSWVSVERMLLTSPGAAVHALGRDRPAGSIRPAHIVDHLAAIYDRGSPVMANKARTYLNCAFAFGMKSAFSYRNRDAVVNWGIAANPVSAVQGDPSANRTRDRFLSPKEFRLFWDWLEAKKDSGVASAIQLEMATGQRLEEVLRLTTLSYQWAEAMLVWSKTKNGLPHSIPLPQQAIEIIDGLVANKHGLYFANQWRPEAPAPYGTAHRAITDYLRQTDADHFCARDLRRTWKTLAGRAGLSKEIRDRLQNHAKGGDISARHYDRYDYLPEKRAAVAQWSDYLDRILAGEFDDERSAEVVKISAEAA